MRLDEVVLRALEKDPELRYQHVSQVKTAVDTIASQAAPPPSASGAALAGEILAREYILGIRSCVRRGWKLLKQEFWPFIGITALFIALLGFASSMGGAVVRHGPAGDNSSEISSAVAMLVWGPLMGGLMFYFLKKIRHEPATVETAFCGFSAERFLHLFLAGFVTSLLTGLGFFCLVLPGIYLTIAWMFTLPLVMDKRLDFWSAMELSRKVVTKHWFKFLGLGLVLLLLFFAGVVMLVIGLFVMSPLILASLMYAYEDVFGGATGTAPPVQTGPSGTVVTPAAVPEPAREPWGLTTKIGLAVVALVLAILLARIMTHSAQEHRRQQAWEQEAVSAPEPVAAQTVALEPPVTPAVPTEPQAPTFHPAFGPPVEQVLTNLTAVNLASGKMEEFPASVTDQNRGPDKDAAACTWMEREGLDFAFMSDYDGFYGMTRDLDTLKREDWDSASPESVAEALQDKGQDVTAKFGEASRLDNPTNYTFGFKTRDGTVGLLQFIGYSDNPRGAKIRYKLASRPPVEADAIPTLDTSSNLQEQFSERLDAASEITNISQKDKVLTAIAMNAAESCEGEIVKNTLGQIYNMTQRDEATRSAAIILALHGLRKQGIELAKGINNLTTRDEALTELAQQHLPGTTATP